MITYWHLPCFMTRAEQRNAPSSSRFALTGPSKQRVNYVTFGSHGVTIRPSGEIRDRHLDNKLIWGESTMSNNKQQRARAVFAKKSSVIATEIALALMAAQIAYAQQPAEQAAPPQQPPEQ